MQGWPVVEVTALITLCVIARQVVRYLLNRGTKIDDLQERAVDAAQIAVSARIAELAMRIEHLESEVKRLNEENSAERHRKHEAMAEAATYLGTLRVVKHMVALADPPDLPGLLAPLLAHVD